MKKVYRTVRVARVAAEEGRKANEVSANCRGNVFVTDGFEEAFKRFEKQLATEKKRIPSIKAAVEIEDIRKININTVLSSLASLCQMYMSKQSRSIQELGKNHQLSDGSKSSYEIALARLTSMQQCTTYYPANPPRMKIEAVYNSENEWSFQVLQENRKGIFESHTTYSHFHRLSSLF